ncbi:hypothetical protein EV138_2379 [Kribbella voronezhensis]|uniref:Uncharacterized protein n=1 Tax=Kribbella voronezhensis TaxID=2512212 RepID=A0A4R7TBW1_9ACTN|nr:hypothetical protein [Kribbella voronezhensis]TDU88828.1 hypothetical protein EV138_2379 [Kribbella voronezhensis]
MSTEVQPSFVVPDLLQGQWTTALICTYGANLTFFETRLMSQLAQVPLRMILADSQQLASRLGEAARTGQRHRSANKAYVVAPIRHVRAAHGKLILLLGPASGRLVVGSGNLSYDGYASPGELWRVFAYSEEQPQHLDEFAAARMFVDALSERQLVDSPVVELLQMAWGGSNWLPESPSLPTAIGGNFTGPLIDRLRSRVKGPVNELIAHAPFHDSDCAALKELVAVFNPKQVRLLVTDATSADPAAIERSLDGATRAIVERVQVKGEPAAYIHAKWVHLIQSREETLLSGSANLSRSALLQSASSGNIEIGVITTGPRGSFDSIYSHLVRTAVRDIASLPISYQAFADGEADEDDQGNPVVLWSRLDGRTLTIIFSEPLAAGATLQITDHAGRTVEIGSQRLVGPTVQVSLTANAAALISEGGRVVVRIDGVDDYSSSTWPYQVAHLKGRLDKASQREHLPRLADLPEQDAELFELLRELDQTLIIDREAVWRIAKPNIGRESRPAGSDEPIALGDLDWDRVRRDPRYGGYLSRGHTAGLPPTDIQIVLAAIGGRLGDLGLDTRQLDVEREEDLAKEGDVGLSSDGQEADEELEDELVRKHMPVTTRTRMAFDRFVRRYAAALDDADFIDELGPIPAAINAVVFNHLLVRLLERDAVSPRWAIPAQAKTWMFLWGKPGGQSLASRFDDETASVVRSVLADAGARTTTLRGLAGSADHITEQEGFAGLQNMVRYLLTDDEFGVNVDGLAEAAGDLQMAPRLLGALEQAAAPTTDVEILELVIAPYGITRSSVEWRQEQVRRVGHGAYPSTTFVITAPVSDLTAGRAREMLGRVAVAAYYAGHEGAYFRIRFAGNGKAVAFWDEGERVGVVMVGDEEQELEWIDPPWPAWAMRLDELESTLMARSKVAHTA